MIRHLYNTCAIYGKIYNRPQFPWDPWPIPKLFRGSLKIWSFSTLKEHNWFSQLRMFLKWTNKNICDNNIGTTYFQTRHGWVIKFSCNMVLKISPQIELGGIFEASETFMSFFDLQGFSCIDLNRSSCHIDDRIQRNSYLLIGIEHLNPRTDKLLTAACVFSLMPFQLSYPWVC